MADELVTAAVFGDHTQALAARLHLEEAGIPAFLQDELMSQGLFVVGGATGGIKLQVPASRLAEAVRLIDERMPDRATPVDWSEVDVGEPEEDEPAAAEGPPTEPGPAPSSVATEAAAEEGPRDLTLREQRADRIVRGALIGLFAWPVLVLAVWRLIQIANSDERLRPEYARKANLATWIVAGPVLVTLLFCCALPFALMGR